MRWGRDGRDGIEIWKSPLFFLSLFSFWKALIHPAYLEKHSWRFLRER